MVTQEQQPIIDHAQLQKINGWQHIKVKGTPYECGFQEGYLLADEYQDALRVYKFATLETFGMTYEWFAEQALSCTATRFPPAGSRAAARHNRGPDGCRHPHHHR